jgi:hypothetical protein
VYQPDLAAGQKPSGSAAGAVEPCAARLQDISGALLLFFQEHNRLPDTLDELRPMNAFGAPLQFVCPTNGQPYVYATAPVQGDPGARWILMYDATPLHDGHRWVILGRPPQGRQPVSMWVVSLDEKTFQRLERATTQPATPAAPAETVPPLLVPGPLPEQTPAPQP